MGEDGSIDYPAGKTEAALDVKQLVANAVQAEAAKEIAEYLEDGRTPPQELLDLVRQSADDEYSSRAATAPAVPAKGPCRGGRHGVVTSR